MIEAAIAEHALRVQIAEGEAVDGLVEIALEIGERLIADASPPMRIIPYRRRSPGGASEQAVILRRAPKTSFM